MKTPEFDPEDIAGLADWNLRLALEAGRAEQKACEVSALLSIAASLREIAGLMRDEAMPIEVTANSIEELRGALGLTPIGGAS